MVAIAPHHGHCLEMEEEFGTHLFDRNTKPLGLASAGRLFYEESMQILRRVTQMRATMKRFVSGQRSRLVVGLAPLTRYARLLAAGTGA